MLMTQAESTNVEMPFSRIGIRKCNAALVMRSTLRYMSIKAWTHSPVVAEGRSTSAPPSFASFVTALDISFSTAIMRGVSPMFETTQPEGNRY